MIEPRALNTSCAAGNFIYTSFGKTEPIDLVTVKLERLDAQADLQDKITRWESISVNMTLIHTRYAAEFVALSDTEILICGGEGLKIDPEKPAPKFGDAFIFNTKSKSVQRLQSRLTMDGTEITFAQSAGRGVRISHHHIITLVN